MSFDHLIGYILSISMCMQNFIIIFFTVQEIGQFSLFQNLELGKASTDKKCQFAISWGRYCQYQCLRKSLSKYSTQFKRYGHFHFFRIWHSAKPRPMINIILQFLGLDIVNINVSAKFYQNIPNVLRVKFHCFQNVILDQSQMSFDYLMGYIMSISMCMQNFIKIFHSVQEIVLFSLFQNLALGKASTNDKCHFAISWTRCRQYQCVCKIFSKYSKRFKSYRHFSRTGQRQNLHKLSSDKIKSLIIGHSMKVNLQFQLTFLGSCNI